jgi:hypothetical protein
VITTNDMRRLISELSVHPEENAETWCEENGIEVEVITNMVEAMKRAMMAAMILNGGDMEDAFGSAILTTFLLGWETHKQYG